MKLDEADTSTKQEDSLKEDKEFVPLDLSCEKVYIYYFIRNYSLFLIIKLFLEDNQRSKWRSKHLPSGI